MRPPQLARAVRAAIESALTPHQRRVALELLVEEVPIDVLADRLGTARNALYKTATTHVNGFARRLPHKATLKRAHIGAPHE